MRYFLRDSVRDSGLVQQPVLSFYLPKTGMAKGEREEKRVARQSVDILATLYDYKRNKARGKDQKAYDEYDAKFNIYDKLHEKYQ